jgi:hypothetical protein
VDTPQEAKQKLHELEKRVAELADGLKKVGPKRLSDEQKKLIISAISNSEGSHVSIEKDGASPDAATLSSDLIDAFQRGGWQVSTPMILGLGNPPPSGVAVKVPEPQKRSLAQQAIVNAFEAADVAYDIQSLQERPFQETDCPDSTITLTTATNS